MEGEAFSWKSYLVQCLWEFGIFNIGLMVGLAVAQDQNQKRRDDVDLPKMQKEEWGRSL
jgi:hypothetical protein